MKVFKNILVVQTAFPGDIVLTTPLFKALKKRFPESRLSVLTTPPGCELLKEIKEIDALISYDKKGADKDLLSYVRLIKKLKRLRFDLCISPHRSARTSFMVIASGIDERIGYSEASLSFLYSKKVVRDDKLHEVDRILSLLIPLDINVDEEDKQPCLALSQESSENMGKRFDELGIRANDLTIGVAPGSVWETKRWTAEGFASLIDNLIETYHAKVLLLGAPSDSAAGNEVLSRCKHEPINLVGKTTLRELIAVIDRCRLLIGNDSAPGHIAAARNVPVISIFGPTVPSFGYSPFGKDVIIVEKELPCRPCHHHGPRTCPESHFLCMKDIKSEEIMEQAKRFLK
ncbi:MAG: lipopolysaccharide heptosyltransferase II [Proteobacteria bacterium]|nr:lipopolysaccharide heptosyltransferase II [Pseudomonadota bacterium]